MADKAAVRARFEAVFPSLVKELTDYVAEQNFPETAVKWFADNLNYNTPGGKLNRGLSVVDTYAIIVGKASALDLEEEEYKLAAILGWSVELLQAYFLVADDMMDQSVTRRGQPCWYRVKNVGDIAINDAFMLEAAIYFLLKKHFRSHSSYVDLLELFHEVTFQTELGQLIDLLTAPEDHVDLDKFTLHKHHLIVVYKTAFYSFYLPVALAARLAGVKDEAQYKAALDILLPLGEYFQVQDDYLDAYAPPEVLGKIGTDIQDNKCSWVINTALAHVTPEQRQVLDANYGRKDAAAEAKVKEIFAAPNVDVKAKFEAYEAQSYEKITNLIKQFPDGSSASGPVLKPEVFTVFLGKVYKRSK